MTTTDLQNTYDRLSRHNRRLYRHPGGNQAWRRTNAVTIRLNYADQAEIAARLAARYAMAGRPHLAELWGSLVALRLEDLGYRRRP